jgi:hypothetical protein
MSEDVVSSVESEVVKDLPAGLDAVQQIGVIIGATNSIGARLAAAEQALSDLFSFVTNHLSVGHPAQPPAPPAPQPAVTV